MERDKSFLVLLLVVTTLILGCAQTHLTTPSLTFTEIPEEVSIATEYWVQTQNVLKQETLPTILSLPTLTLTDISLPTLTPLPNSTPAAIGAYFDVPSDVLGPHYEIENAYYFDKLESGERYEFYAGAIAGSGNEETAQGVMILRVLRFSEQVSNVEVIETQEYLTPIQVGPLRINVDFSGNILLFTPLNFEWAFFVRQREMIDLKNPPLAKLESGEEKQLAGRGSFCWQGNCLDGAGISTSTIPLVVLSSSIIRLHLPLVENPTVLNIQTMLVSPPGILEFDNVSDTRASWSYEKAGRELLNQGALSLRQDQNIKLSLESGYYVLIIFASWHDYGDVKYGFLIEVKE